MKRFLSLTLALTLLLASASVLAADQGLDWKMREQMKNGSGFRMEATLKTEGGLPFALTDQAAETALLSLINRSRLEFSMISAMGVQKGRQQAELKLNQNGMTYASAAYLSDGVIEAFSSSLLGKDTYAAPKGEALGNLKDAPTAWPGIFRALYAVTTADNSWSAVAGQRFSAYTAKLNDLLKNHTGFTTGRNAKGELETQTRISVPADALKGMMKQLLSSFYQDTALHTLLKERMTTREAAAWLNPEMEKNFAALIDSLSISEPLTVHRIFDKTGALVQDEVFLPMGGVQGVRSISYASAAASGQDSVTLDIRMETKDGQDSRIVLQYTASSPGTDGAAKTYRGTLSMTGRERPFVVADDNAPDEAYDFELTYAPAAKLYDRQKDRFSQKLNASLTLTPKKQNAETMRVSLGLTLSSGSQNKSATQLEGALALENKTTGKRLIAQLSGRTTAPWQVPAIDEKSAVRLDSMTADQLNAQKEAWQQTIMQSFAAILQSLIQPPTP